MHRENPLVGGNRLKLGLFSPNCSGGMAITTVLERWDASWDNNLALARMADSAGIEFLLPIARWSGYGGETDFQGTALETITWATGLLAATQRIAVAATVHTAFSHPIVAAKQFVTADQIAHGRFALNIVCGWNRDEYEMFGLDLPRTFREGAWRTKAVHAYAWWLVLTDGLICALLLYSGLRGVLKLVPGGDATVYVAVLWLAYLAYAVVMVSSHAVRTIGFLHNGRLSRWHRKDASLS